MTEQERFMKEAIRQAKKSAGTGRSARLASVIVYGWKNHCERINREMTE